MTISAEALVAMALKEPVEWRWPRRWAETTISRVSDGFGRGRDTARCSWRLPAGHHTSDHRRSSDLTVVPFTTSTEKKDWAIYERDVKLDPEKRLASKMPKRRRCANWRNRF